MWNIILKFIRPCSSRILNFIGLTFLIFILVFNVFIYIDIKVNAPKGPNIILISVDTLRADHLGCYGYHRNTSPNIDKFAGDGITFRNAISLASWTFPAMSGLLTSQYPTVLGSNDPKWRTKIDERFLFLAECLKNSNYLTYAIVGNSSFGADVNVDQGFSVYNSDIAGKELHKSVSSHKVTDQAISFLENYKDTPFFLFLFYFDPHFNYFLHEEYNYFPNYAGPLKSNESIVVPMNKDETKRKSLTKEDIGFLVSCYDSEINYTDKHIGRLLKELKRLGVYDNSVIILVGDHGEEFMERGFLGHDTSLYQELIHVPLIIKLPYQNKKGTFVDSYISTINIMPSLLDLLEFEIPSDLEGEAIDFNRPNDVVEANIFSISPTKCIISKQKKLIFSKKEPLKLYDLQNDPFEMHDLSDKMPEETKKFEEILNNWFIRVKNKKVSMGLKKKTVEYREEKKKELKALGYL
ncbi:sulfatase [Thermoproteota archaeon]